VKSEKRKYQKATWVYWKDYQEKFHLLFFVQIVKIMELSPFKSITGSDTFWDGSTPNPLSVGIPTFPTLVADLFGTRSDVRWFLSPATEVSGVVWETEVGIPTLRGLGVEPSQKVSLPVMDLNGLNSIIFTI
jgi:hypothetical protein